MEARTANIKCTWNSERSCEELKRGKIFGNSNDKDVYNGCTLYSADTEKSTSMNTCKCYCNNGITLNST